MRFVVKACLSVSGMMAVQAQAVPVDRFTCTARTMKETEEVSTANFDLVGVRQSLSQSPKPEVRLFSGNVGFSEKVKGGTVIFGLDYTIATELDANDMPKRGAFYSCGPSVSACLDGLACAKPSCLAPPPDPFDPIFAWLWKPLKATEDGNVALEGNVVPGGEAIVGPYRVNLSCRFARSEP